MLYVTTRNNRDAYTAQRALKENRGPDGGFYLPFRHPKLKAEELDALAKQSFGQRVAEILNLLFQTRLTGWDVDFAIGRSAVRLAQLRHRILLGECWHNPDWEYSAMQRNLCRLVTGNIGEPASWVKIAVNAAVLFGIYGELHRDGIEEFDLSVVSGDYTLPISAWYARKWGLPIGNIVCCCNENKNLWDLICHGQMRTDTVVIPTALPEADYTVPCELERLIHGCGGAEETERFLEACRRGISYSVTEPMLAKLRDGQYVSVVSSKRAETTIPSVYRTHGYLLSPGGALAYSGLLDYRAKSGQTRHAVVLCEKSPALYGKWIAGLMGITEEELRKLTE